MARILGSITPPATGRVLGSVPATTPTATAPQASDPTTMASQATFQASPTDNPLVAGLKTAGNLPSSAFNFVKNAIGAVNPLNIAKNVMDIGATAADVKNKGLDAGNVALDTATGIPAAAYHQLVPQFIQHIVSGDLHGAAAALENDPIGQIAPLILLGRGAAERAGVAPQFDSAISKTSDVASAPIRAAASGVSDVSGGVTRFLGGQLVGLSPATIEKVITNPREFSHQAQTDITRGALGHNIAAAITERQSALADHGPAYDGVRTQTDPIPVQPDYLDQLITDKTGLKVINGKLTTSGSASIRTPSDVSALQNKLYNVWQPEFAKGYLTADEFLNLRTDLAGLAKLDSGVGKSGPLENLSNIMRAQLNTDIRPSIPGLTQLDKSYAPQIAELQHLSKGLIDKSTGTLSDAAINRIANATGKGKDLLLNRLEQLSPGITDKIKILKAVEDIQNSRENRTGTYTRAAALGAGLVTLNPYLLITSIASIPEIAIPLMRGLGYSADTIEKISNTLGLPKAGKSLKAVNDLPSKLPSATAAAATSNETTQ